MTRRAWALGLALALAAAAAAAQTPPAPAPVPAAPAVPAVATAAQRITLVAGTGVLLRLTLPAGTMMSAEPAVARVQPASPTSLFLMGVAPGRTTVLATTDAGAPIAQYDVTVTPAPGATGLAAAAPPMAGLPGAPPPAGPLPVSPATAAAIRAAIAQSVPGAANVTVRATGSGVTLGGVVPTAAAALQAEAIAHAYLADKGAVLDGMEVLGSVQVNVRVRIAEIDRQITRQLGFNWQALGSGTPWQFGMLTGGAAAGAISPLLPLGALALNGSNAYQVGAGYMSSHGDVNGIIDALAADQLITVLAEPNLTAQSGETASFLAGGEFPIPVSGSTSNGSVQISVEFKQYGVSLSVVPTVIAPDRLNLRIRPEVSQLSTNGAVSVPIGSGTLTIPALTVRRAETTIELGSGQSFAIAGLLQHTSTDVASALPYLGELPVLGALFKSTQFQRGDSELVIIVTPYIVRPVASPALLHLPTDRFAPATDLDRILFGRQLANPAAPGAGAGLPSGAGFILK